MSLICSRDHPDWAAANERIIEFVKKYSQNQGRAPDKFGGSEMGVIIGIDTHRSLKDLISNKVTRVNNSNVITRWGDMMEPKLRHYLDLIWGTEIHEPPMSIPSQYDGVTFSGDGIGAIVGADGKVRIVLFEFKNPFSRIPVPGKIPPHYVAQPNTGLCNENFAALCDVGLFCDALFRACSADQFNDSVYEYNTQLHKFFKVPDGVTVMDRSFIGFYTDPAHTNSEIARTMASIPMYCVYYSEKRNHGLIDFGAEGEVIISELLAQCDKNLSERIQYYQGAFVNVNKKHGKPFVLQDELAEFKRWAEERGYVPHGFICVKLYRLVIVQVEKNTEYLEPHREKIAQAVDLLRKALASNIEEKK